MTSVSALATDVTAKWNLPPLILHPFSGGGSTDALLEGTQAALALQGLSNPDAAEAELRLRVLNGRYQEIRMLLFLGKDLFRWMQQCVDYAERAAEPDSRINEQSFSALLVESPPPNVSAKLEKWGVTDRRAVFSRAVGIHSLFEMPPPRDFVSPVFLNNYHRFADHAYICFQHLRPFRSLDASSCAFDIYASEEYARLLSDQWERG
jgi:hypothetical protein